MRIKELADLTGTTVRTIRYYHQIDLLPVPVERYGRRDYDLVHVARLARIRWLVQAGVPLSRIAGILGPPAAASASASVRDAVLADLRATLVTLDDQLARVRAQRDRVRRLVASVEQDEHLSPMPLAMTRFYNSLEQRAGEDKVRREIQRERDFLELAFYRGDIPPEADIFYQYFDETQLAESLDQFGRAAGHADSEPAPTDAELEQAAAAHVARLRRRLGAALPQLAATIDMDVAYRAGQLYLRITPDPDRPRVRVFVEAILAMLHEARAQGT
ncbi:MerR family transcriptional regulator [Dactylosporangium matsuzakiense]|uniref:HTH merR-type domain-containing protein n=1 Tax=Dactylosporangium matsuzakiense TaxID=53360 RepID=A0A9W6KUT6_9ACTN|nr:MerR family transcriptional regulator [Dactylosporangium matsuzakiense]GLL06921.1 hypothetical protein GCM10017581_086710 [Dactylosporangium matsuzakiense]